VRTLSGYGIAAALVLVAPNLVAWITGYPRRLHDLNIFSVGSRWAWWACTSRRASTVTTSRRARFSQKSSPATPGGEAGLGTDGRGAIGFSLGIAHLG